MSKKTDPLGRGLDTILGGSNAQYTTPAAQQIVAVREIPLTQIEVNPFQPRTEFSEEELQELADSIAKIGIR